MADLVFAILTVAFWAAHCVLREGGRAAVSLDNAAGLRLRTQPADQSRARQ